MSIQWFPGHMHATRKALSERLKATDVVIEMLDARLPGSSANPLLARMVEGLPVLKVLSKQDLADPVRTACWLEHYQSLPMTHAIAIQPGQAGLARQLVAPCRQLAPGRGGMVKPIRILIAGIPNVGKSTLINALVGRKAAKTGDIAGVTRQEQRIVLADDAYLYDTPGILWPKITVPESGYLLAASGAVGRNAYDDTEVALELLKILRQDYPALLQQRYRLDMELPLIPATDEEVLLQAVAQRRGGLGAGGRLDWGKAAAALIADFRTGALGAVTLETPQGFARWDRQAREAEAEQALLRQLQRAPAHRSRE